MRAFASLGPHAEAVHALRGGGVAGLHGRAALAGARHHEGVVEAETARGHVLRLTHLAVVAGHVPAWETQRMPVKLHWSAGALPGHCDVKRTAPL